MRIDYITLSDIHFTYSNYSSSLKESLLRIGQNFPIYVRRNEDGSYTCRDGHKRLSAISDILAQDPFFHRFQTLRVIIEDHARTAAPYSLHNHH